jgi:uncharacterized protein (DUF1330 family)
MDDSVLGHDPEKWKPLPARPDRLIYCARKSSCHFGHAEVQISGSDHAVGGQFGGPMRTHIKTALALMIGIVLGGVGFGALHAQTKAPPAYWVVEVQEMRDRAAVMRAIHAVQPTVQKFGGRYIVFGGELAADVGPLPKRVAIVAFDSMDNAQRWLSDPTAKALRQEVNKYAKTRAFAVEGTAD